MIPLRDNVPTARFPVVTVALIAICVAVFAWQLSLSGSEEFSSQWPGISERDAKTIEYGAIPYRLLHPGEDCALGAEAVSPTVAEPAVVCQGTDEYREASGLHEQNPGSIPPPLPLDAVPWYLTILTSMFMHGGFLHIAFNMLFLWIFGNNVEDSMGRVPFLGFYLLGGAAAVYAQSILDPGSTVPTIGASGAVAAVLGGYLLLLPRARVLTLVFLVFLITIVEIPAYVVLGIWFVLQFLPAIGQATATDVAGEGVAYMAHVGGFVFGLALIKLFARRPPGRAPAPQYPVG
ncbi:MAG TPA: rhomboid family intramembrane serine protease [Solirubrobacterales bacterium]